RFTVDALGDVSENVYDAAGNQVTSTRYATRPTPGVADYTESGINAAVDRTNANNQVTQSAYDKAGRLRFKVRVLTSDATGQASWQHVTEQRYDALGQLVQVTAYFKPF